MANDVDYLADFDSATGMLRARFVRGAFSRRRLRVVTPSAQPVTSLEIRGVRHRLESRLASTSTAKLLQAIRVGLRALVGFNEAEALHAVASPEPANRDQQIEVRSNHV